jgi:MFS family permease
MKRTVRYALLSAAILAIAYFGGFVLAHWINDVLIAPENIEWLAQTVYWFRDRFVPFIREPDDIEALYLLALLGICWLGVLIALLALLAICSRRRVRFRDRSDSP